MPSWKDSVPAVSSSPPPAPTAGDYGSTSQGSTSPPSIYHMNKWMRGGVMERYTFKRRSFSVFPHRHPDVVPSFLPHASSASSYMGGVKHQQREGSDQFNLPRNNPFVGTKRYAAAGLADLLNDDSSSVDSIISRGDYLSDSDERHNSFSGGGSDTEADLVSSRGSHASKICPSCGQMKCNSCGIPDWSFAKVGSLLLLP